MMFGGLFMFGMLASASAYKINETMPVTTISKPNVSDLQPHVSENLLSFALKLCNKMYNKENRVNVLLSPISVYSALTTIHMGAAADTQDEIGKALGMPKNSKMHEQWHATVGSMGKMVQQTDEATVKMANGLFVQKSVHLREQFIQQINQLYGNEVSSVDFTLGGSTATDYINDWISQKTEGRISKLYENKLPDDTKVALVNSLFYSARWAYQFGNESTKTEKFNTDKEVVEVPMMTNRKNLYYLNYPQGSFEAIALPYVNDEFTMYIALPYANATMKDVLANLTIENIIAAVINAVQTDVEYKIPKMKFRWSGSIKQQLIELGLSKFFQASDFSNMVSTPDLSVSDVVHGAEMDVNEQGTMASGVTSAVFNTYSNVINSNRDEPIKFYLKRPFMLCINHGKTIATMFTAVVHNPLEM